MDIPGRIREEGGSKKPRQPKQLAKTEDHTLEQPKNLNTTPKGRGCDPKKHPKFTPQDQHQDPNTCGQKPFPPTPPGVIPKHCPLWSSLLEVKRSLRVVGVITRGIRSIFICDPLSLAAWFCFKTCGRSKVPERGVGGKVGAGNVEAKDG